MESSFQRQIRERKCDQFISRTGRTEHEVRLTIRKPIKMQKEVNCNTTKLVR